MIPSDEAAAVEITKSQCEHVAVLKDRIRRDINESALAPLVLPRFSPRRLKKSSSETGASSKHKAMTKILRVDASLGFNS